MSKIANPAFPKQDQAIGGSPGIVSFSDSVRSFQELPAVKMENPGNDVLTYMPEDKG